MDRLLTRLSRNGNVNEPRKFHLDFYDMVRLTRTDLTVEVPFLVMQSDVFPNVDDALRARVASGYRSRLSAVLKGYDLKETRPDGSKVVLARVDLSGVFANEGLDYEATRPLDGPMDLHEVRRRSDFRSDIGESHWIRAVVPFPAARYERGPLEEVVAELKESAIEKAILKHVVLLDADAMWVEGKTCFVMLALDVRGLPER